MPRRMMPALSIGYNALERARPHVTSTISVQGAQRRVRYNAAKNKTPQERPSPGSPAMWPVPPPCRVLPTSARSAVWKIARSSAAVCRQRCRAKVSRW